VIPLTIVRGPERARPDRMPCDGRAGRRSNLAGAPVRAPDRVRARRPRSARGDRRPVDPPGRRSAGGRPRLLRCRSAAECGPPALPGRPGRHRPDGVLLSAALRDPVPAACTPPVCGGRGHLGRDRDRGIRGYALASRDSPPRDLDRGGRSRAARRLDARGGTDSIRRDPAPHDREPIRHRPRRESQAVPAARRHLVRGAARLAEGGCARSMARRARPAPTRP